MGSCEAVTDPPNRCTGQYGNRCQAQWLRKSTHDPFPHKERLVAIKLRSWAVGPPCRVIATMYGYSSKRPLSAQDTGRAPTARVFRNVLKATRGAAIYLYRLQHINILYTTHPARYVQVGDALTMTYDGRTASAERLRGTYFNKLRSRQIAR